jgi:glycosyltransferase involved in cell wall biosynthesis
MLQAKRLIARIIRGVLLRIVRRPASEPGGDRRLIIVLWTAWNMGGTIRAAFNLAEYMQERGWSVEIVSGYRDRDVPFFGSFPAGVPVHDLDDRRNRGRLQRLLRKLPSVLMPSADRAATNFSVWTDIQLVRRLRGRTGVLLGTRPGVNLMLSRLRAPGLRTVGLEQMNLHKHNGALRRSMRKLYPQLDAFVVLTERDREHYHEQVFNDNAPPLHVIPNTLRPLPGAKADLGAKTVYAAGRFRYQKGFELLIPAWEATAKAHPDWTLRLRGRGHLETRYRGLIEQHGLEDTVVIEGPAEDIGSDMAEAAVFVLSSRFEGFPLILLEAMSKGMGIVSFDCPTGPADIVDDHRNGLLVPQEDVEGLSRAIREIVEDEELRRRMAAEAVETAQEYTIEAIGPLWVELLEGLGRQPRPSTP